MQALLAEYAWNWKAVLAALQRFIVAQLGDPVAIVVLDETAELKKGTATVGVARQECFQQGKGQVGLDQHQVRTWQSFHRHTVPSICAHALLAIAAARWPASPQPGTTPASCPPPQTTTRTAASSDTAGRAGAAAHQARARWHHNHARLKAAQAT